MRVAPNLTQPVAVRRADEHVEIAFAVLARPLTRRLGLAVSLPCPEHRTAEGERWLSVSRSYRMDGLTGDSIHTLHDWWQRNGFRPLADRRPARNYVWLENATDGFRVALKEGRDGTVSMTVTSPCFPPS